MSYTKDRYAPTRRAGGIAAIDMANPRAARAAAVTQARNLRARDQRMALLTYGPNGGLVGRGRGLGAAPFTTVSSSGRQIGVHTADTTVWSPLPTLPVAPFPLPDPKPIPPRPGSRGPRASAIDAARLTRTRAELTEPKGDVRTIPPPRDEPEGPDLPEPEGTAKPDRGGRGPRGGGSSGGGGGGGGGGGFPAPRDPEPLPPLDPVELPEPVAAPAASSGNRTRNLLLLGAAGVGLYYLFRGRA